MRSVSLISPVSLGDALLANGTGRSDRNLLRLGHDLRPAHLDKLRITEELVEHRVDERNVLRQVLGSLAAIAASAASLVVRQRGDVIEKLVHEVSGDVLPRRVLEIADRAEVDGVALDRPRRHDRQRRRRRRELVPLLLHQRLVPHQLVQLVVD